ncbi:MAG: hypothetical protein H6922_06650 [Pseudomonadaceae bacterium]|nr:hypothetical protein [Pseudomonadaceae bacterium]
MSWVGFVLVGAVVNVLNNLGYKMMGGKDSFLFLAGCVAAVAAVTLFSYSLYSRTLRMEDAVTGHMPWVILAMGIGTALVLLLFIQALAKGPLALVDPMWACVYALTSAVVGMVLLREQPSILALSGVGLYLVGAFLMAKG